MGRSFPAGEIDHYEFTSIHWVVRYSLDMSKSKERALSQNVVCPD